MTDSAFGAFAVNLALTAAAALLAMVAAFAVAVSIRRYRIVDVAWGLAFCAVALVTVVHSAGHGDGGRRALITTLTLVWGLRLSVHIGRRSRGAPEDPRYEELLSRAGDDDSRRARYAFTHVFLLQGVLVWFISLPVQAGQFSTTGLSSAPAITLAALGTALWACGLYFEAVGDWQLARFKADPGNRKALLTTGLRRYTRHPNYFGDACVWWGLYLLAADQWLGLATILSPVAMTWLLTRVSGTPLMEAHLSRTRPEYAEYAARTSGFIPRRPRGQTS